MNTRRICVFGLRINQTSLVWAWVQQVFSHSIIQLIVKIQRIVYRRGDFPRYDFLLGPKDRVSQDIIDSFTSELNNRGCRARLHIPDRRLRPSRRNTSATNDSITPASNGTNNGDSTTSNRAVSSLVLATLNVNSIKGKKAQVLCMMESIGVDILLLQETLRETSVLLWNLSFPGCRVFEQGYQKDTHGARGLAIVVKSKYAVETIGSPADNWLFVRVFGDSLPNPVIVGSVYIPHTGRRGCLGRLAAAIKGLHEKYPTTPIIVGGDWNGKVNAVVQWFQRSDLNADSWKGRVCNPTNQYPQWITRCVGIDHFVTFSGSTDTLFENEFSKQTLIRSKWDISDHCVVTHCRKWESGSVPNNGTLSQSSHSENNEKLTIDRNTLKERTRSIAFHNYWQPLSQEMDNMDNCDDLTSKFVETSYRVLENVEVRKRVTSQRKTVFTPHFLKRKLIRLNRLREAAYNTQSGQGRNPGSNPNNNDLRQAYLRQKKQVKKEIRDYSRKKWLDSIRTAVKNLKGSNSALSWRWLKRCIGKGKESSNDSVKPITHEDGRLLLDSDEIKDRWARHFQALAADPTGHSRDKSYWENSVTFNPSKILPQEDVSKLEEDITWREMKEALVAAKRNKATGMDELPMEFYQSALEETEEGERSPFSFVLEKLTNCLWTNASNPEMWMDAILVSIFKSGDPTLCDNYRGISLMDCGLKVLAIIVARRLGAVFDRSGFLIREQVGFRFAEETMSQVCALIEACGRRRNANLQTFITFVDLRKAYDTVPHEALFVKMEKYGVGPKTMAWLRSLYSASCLRIRCGSGLSPRVSLHRGLRQGCPLSPILFDIFIDDCLEGARESGASIPGCVEKLQGLLFADDLAIIAGSPVDMTTSIRSFETWCNTWEMSVGISKCGIMGIGNEAQAIARTYEWPTLQGGHIPRVDEYLYLGCLLDYELKPETACKHREKQGTKVLGMISRLLATGSVPVGLKRLAIKVVLVPCLVYGSEWFGMNKGNVKVLQRVLNRAIRLCVGAKMESSWIPLGPLMTELGIEPIHVTACKRRARAFLKYKELNSWISQMINHPARQRKRTWVSLTKAWMKGLHVRDENGILEAEPSSDLVGVELLKKTSEKMREKGSYAGKLYQRWQMEKTNKWYKVAWSHPQWSWGATALLRFRLNCYWDAKRLARAKLINEAYRNKCPMCDEDGKPETVEHIIFECRKWDNYRGDIQSLIRCVREEMTRHAVTEDWNSTVYMCCGGTIANGKSIDLWEKLMSHLNREKEDEESQSQTSDNLPLESEGMHRSEKFLVDFIRFLTKVHIERWKILSQMKKNTTGQSPHGYDGAGTAQAQLMIDDGDPGGGDDIIET